MVNRDTVTVTLIDNIGTVIVALIDNRGTVIVTLIDNRGTAIVILIDNRSTVIVTLIDNRGTLKVALNALTIQLVQINVIFHNEVHTLSINVTITVPLLSINVAITVPQLSINVTITVPLLSINVTITLFDVFIIKKENKNNRYTNSSFEYVYYCNLLYDLGHQPIKKKCQSGWKQYNNYLLI
jgi:hypothetical protein